MEHHVITIGANAETTIEAKGFIGKACLAGTKWLHDLLGVQTITPTAAMTASNTTAASQRQSTSQ